MEHFFWRQEMFLYWKEDIGEMTLECYQQEHHVIVTVIKKLQLNLKSRNNHWSAKLICKLVLFKRTNCGNQISVWADWFWWPECIRSYRLLHLKLVWGTSLFSKGPVLAAKVGPGGYILATKMVRWISFWRQNFIPGPILARTNLGWHAHHQIMVLYSAVLFRLLTEYFNSARVWATNLFLQSVTSLCRLNVNSDTTVAASPIIQCVIF